ncbi:HET-domain-containing protein [Astrocystis sublimbata]|nr:HET-domain-containing protein [Astrocystis sublimbata]
METDPRSPVVLAPHLEFLPIDSSRGQIRLLQIAPGRTGAPIRCSYQISAVDGDVPYQTLSYVWGAMDGNKMISVEGTAAEVTDNLFAALTRIRHAAEPRHLWVDALCINQQDGDEKTAQVNMMHKIYANCVQCNLWMGNIDAAAIGVGEAEALEAVEGAFSIARVLGAEELVDSQLPPQLASSNQRLHAFKALQALIKTQWWYRIWTVQEATSPRNSVVLWGPASVPWSTMTVAAERLVANEWPPEYEETVSDLCEHGWYSFFTAPILSLKFASAWIENPDPPLDMLWRFRHRDSTDPRDKVYVILNLVAEGTNLLPSVPSSDYTVDAAVLYRRVMLDLLYHDWGLRPLIGHRGEPKQLPNIPSWVIDWTLLPRELEFSSFWEHNNFWFWYTADRGLPSLDRDAMTSPEFGENVLNVNGVFFDKVLLSSDLIAEDDEDDRLQEIIASVIEKALAEEPRYRVISEVYWQDTLESIVDGSYADEDSGFEGLEGDEYWRAYMLRNQRLFITENGAVGLGPSGTSVGDEVWILSGGRSPFLLSPLPSDGVGGKDRDASFHYTLRGDVFIPGVMKGEAIDSRVGNQRFVHIH